MMDDGRSGPGRGPWRREASRDLRRRATPSERSLWDALRHHRLDGKQLRRQHPIGPYIVDFVCPEYRPIVEVDGDIYDMQREYDAERDEYLRDLGYTVMRFTVDRVVADLDGVLAGIRAAWIPG